MKFWKYHGLGNDFVIVEADLGNGLMKSEKARHVCDRHTGVGADGVLTVMPSESAHCRMHIFNADGSEAEMCGNGIRCLVKYLVEKKHINKETIRIETSKSIVECITHIKSDGTLDWVTVQMGPAVFEKPSIPMEGSGECIGQTIHAGDREFVITALSLGNPHVVVFERADMALARKYGPLIENHPWFPNRTNVGFAEITGPDTMKLIVHERGCGITQACGTGASAAMVAAVRLKKVMPEQEMKVHLPGGDLFIRVSSNFSSVLMQGPTIEVFCGNMAEEN